MSIMARLGWDKAQQDDIRNLIRNTRDSMKHLVVGMRTRTGFREGEKFIIVYDRSGVRSRTAYESKPFDDRDKLFEIYKKLIRELGLPYCCPEHEREAGGDSFEFITEDEEEFEFIDPTDDFEFVDEDEGFDLGPEDDEGFDFS